MTPTGRWRHGSKTSECEEKTRAFGWATNQEFEPLKAGSGNLLGHAPTSFFRLDLLIYRNSAWEHFFPWRLRDETGKGLIARSKAAIHLPVNTSFLQSHYLGSVKAFTVTGYTIHTMQRVSNE